MLDILPVSYWTNYALSEISIPSITRRNKLFTKDGRITLVCMYVCMYVTITCFNSTIQMVSVNSK